MSDVSLKAVRKSYGSVEVVHGVDLEITSGEFVVFVGPSGCGKSTLLRMIAGLEDITAGDVYIGGERMNDVRPSRRGVAMVFQSYALYPHMNVHGNMSFSMRLARRPKDEIDSKVGGAADTLQIRDYLDRRPSHLSGGQRQRVAIGRAFVREPGVFLFDEPLSNLDAALRVQTRIEIARLHRSLDATMIYVTHDQVEAMTMADRIVVLNDGVVEQIGTPMELYHTPANLFVAGFIGSPKMNLFAVEPDAGHIRFGDDLGGGTVSIAGGDATTLGVRPEHLQPDPEGPIAAEIEIVENLGEYALIYLNTPGGQQVTMKVADPDGLDAGGEVRIGFAPSRAHLFAADGSRAA